MQIRDLRLVLGLLVFYVILRDEKIGACLLEFRLKLTVIQPAQNIPRLNAASFLRGELQDHSLALRTDIHFMFDRENAEHIGRSGRCRGPGRT